MHPDEQFRIRDLGEEMDFEEKSFIAKVMLDMPASMAEKELELVKQHIRQLYSAGFSIADARACIGVSEEVNPSFPEAEALTIMDRLWEKYKVNNIAVKPKLTDTNDCYNAASAIIFGDDEEPDHGKAYQHIMLANLLGAEKVKKQKMLDALKWAITCHRPGSDLYNDMQAAIAEGEKPFDIEAAKPK